MKHLLIINLHSTSNAGDHALLLMTLESIYTLAPDVQITLSANDPAGFAQSLSREKSVPSFFGWTGHEKHPTWLQRLWLLVRLYIGSLWAALVYRLTGVKNYVGIPVAYQPLVRAYFDADVVLSCPGNFIYSRSYLAGLPILVPIFAMAYAWLLKKPFYLLPQTLGPLHRSWESAVLKWVLRRARAIAVRDVTSVALLERMGFDQDEFQLIPDLAFAFSGAGREAGAELLQQFGVRPEAQNPRLGVTLINWGAQNPAFAQQALYEEAVTQAVRLFLEETDGDVLLFSQVCGPKVADDDRIPARRVAATLGIYGFSTRVYLIDAVLPAATLKAAYSWMDFFLGTRLHSTIFALAEGVPVVAIAYQDKTEGVFQMLGLGAWVIRIEQTTPKSLQSLYRQLWPQRVQMRAQVQQSVHALRQETGHQFNRLLSAALAE